jgi:hypothetical protein
MAEQTAIKIETPNPLGRAVYCDCGWSGRMGQLIAADTLRCPKCRRDDFKMLVPDTPKTAQ